MNRRKFKPSVDIPPPLALAAVQFLSTCNQLTTSTTFIYTYFPSVPGLIPLIWCAAAVEPFKSPHLSVPIIQRLLRTSVHFLKAPKFRPYQEDPIRFLYEYVRPLPVFLFILVSSIFHSPTQGFKSFLFFCPGKAIGILYHHFGRPRASSGGQGAPNF